MMKLCYPFFVWYLDDERYKEREEREKRGMTMMKLSVDMMFYIILSIGGYYVMKDSDYLSTSLLGKGKCSMLTR